MHYISALEGTGTARLFDAIQRAYDSAMAKLSTPKLTRTLMAAIARQAPPRVGMFRPMPRYAHQGGSNPPIIVVHGNHLEGIGSDYRRYLETVFHTAFQLQGTPLRVEF